MNKEFVPYELSLRLKALGFDEPCFVRVWWLNSLNRHTKEPYKPHITMNGHDIKFEYPIPEKHPSSGFDELELQVPTFSQAFKWFREKYGLFHSTNYQDDNSGPGCFDYEILNKRGKTKVEDDGPEFKTYEEAELACLIRLIEIVEKEQENDK